MDVDAMTRKGKGKGKGKGGKDKENTDCKSKFLRTPWHMGHRQKNCWSKHEK